MTSTSTRLLASVSGLAIAASMGCSSSVGSPSGNTYGAGTVDTTAGTTGAGVTATGTNPGTTTTTTTTAGTGGAAAVAVGDTTTGMTTDTTATAGNGTMTATADPNLDITNDPALAEPAPAESAGPLTLRRLSPHEYTNTLRDLVGDNSEPGAGSMLPDEASVDSGFAIVETASTASVQIFMDTAERLVAEGLIGVPCTGQTSDPACATQFIDDFGRRAFRRPVKASERENLLALYDTAIGLGFDSQGALEQVASAMLQSSGFLYLWEIGDEKPVANGGIVPLTQYQLASRLSYLLWGSMPDDTLAAAADAGQLATPEQLGAQAERLLGNTDRVAETVGSFHMQWLHVENLDDLQRDPTLYPGFNDEIRQAYGPAFREYAANSILNGDGTLRSLLTSPTAFSSAALNDVYGVPATGAGVSEISLDATQRAGLLTQAAFLASASNTTGSNPPRRGKIVFDQLLCGVMPPVPADVPQVEPPAENLTTRERFAVHSDNPCATTCHNVLDPLGFAFENFDAIGAYRATESGLDVDASGTLVTPAGGVIEFTDAVGLISQLSTAYEVDRCAATNWFRYMLGRREMAPDLGSLEVAYRASGAGPATDFSVRQFLAQMVQTTAFMQRAVQAGETL